MSSSPVLRRLSTSTSGDPREDLINAYEAEEERIINVLSRKLEQLRVEKISLENALEAESESHVNRLNRELSYLRARQRAMPEEGNGNEGSSVQATQSLFPGSDPRYPSPEAMLDALRKENESLRNRLVDTERDYVRIARLNEIYREELIEHRRRLSLPVDNLITPGSASDPYSQPLHRRSSSHSPNTSVYPPSYALRSTLAAAMPIPRSIPHSYRQSVSQAAGDSSGTTPLTTSPSSSPSPFPFSPITSTNPASYISQVTDVTTPSSASLNSNPPAPYPAQMYLPYPSVPPPSLSSSAGSSTLSDSQTHSPTDLRESRGSRPSARIAETGNLRDISTSRSRRGSATFSQPASPSTNSRVTLPRSPVSNNISFRNGGGGELQRSLSSHRIAETGTLSRRGGNAVGKADG